ncbi:MAG: hypothetical protein WC732_05400 [Candidatus Omnitrophota bacterium]
MSKIYRFFRVPISFLLCLAVLGCATMPKGFLKPPENTLEKRQLQMRQYETRKEEEILSATAGVLQDLGFTLDDSETPLGLVVASKKCDATDGGQIAGAVFLTLLCALGGTTSNALELVDAAQVVKASVIVRPSLEGAKTTTRVTFQRIVWNASNQINRVETLNDPVLYQDFYEKLSKAIFLEAQSI